MSQPKYTEHEMNIIMINSSEESELENVRDDLDSGRPYLPSPWVMKSVPNFYAYLDDPESLIKTAAHYQRLREYERAEIAGEFSADHHVEEKRPGSRVPPSKTPVYQDCSAPTAYQSFSNQSKSQSITDDSGGLNCLFLLVLGAIAGVALLGFLAWASIL
jgi:hypothetical protein